ncbi:MAG: hypothetical protein DMF37_00560 [Verrucomicrobia bacterium]|nr:MAG: hypothetical protein DMF37_00560 [Verrucomicrobiota bacterium]
MPCGSTSTANHGQKETKTTKNEINSPEIRTPPLASLPFEEKRLQARLRRAQGAGGRKLLEVTVDVYNKSGDRR